MASCRRFRIQSPFSLVTLMCLMFVFCQTNASQQTIHLNTSGLYSGIVVGFSSSFYATRENQVTIITSIMNQIQSASDILRQLLGVQFGQVTLMIPSDWNVPLDPLKARFNVEKAEQRFSLSDADILYTDDRNDESTKEQILTMQFGECGEGGLPINFPRVYISHEYATRFLAHQWLLYRYGVFNEFGLVNDFNYPVYSVPADGGLRNDTQPEVTSCLKGSDPQFMFKTECNNKTDPITGRPVNPDCDVIPVANTIQSSFVYAPTAVSEYRLCNATTHDYSSPTKHNVLCDYQSIHDVIKRHFDFERFKPLANQTLPSAVHFKIWQNQNTPQNAPRVFYAVPQHDKSLKTENIENSIKTLSSLAQTSKLVEHLSMLGIYDQSSVKTLHVDWKPISTLPVTSGDGVAPKNINLEKLFNSISIHFAGTSGGTCVLFFSGDLHIENSGVDHIENLIDWFNTKANFGIRVILYDQMPSNDVLNFFEQLTSKLNSKSSVDYAFSHNMETASVKAYRTKLFSVVNDALFNLMQDVIEQTHVLVQRETVRAMDDSTIDFNIDSSMHDSTLLVEIGINGQASDLAFSGLELKDNSGRTIDFLALQIYQQSVVGFYKIPYGMYHFHLKSLNNSQVSDIYETVSMRLVSGQSVYRSYKDGMFSARCWIEAQPAAPLRGYVQVSKGLNGPVIGAEVVFSAKPFTQAQQKKDITFQVHDNGLGNPDITGNDGIYSSYLDQIFVDNNDPYVAYTLTAKVMVDAKQAKHFVKPGNFGNTVMFSKKPRCCGSEIKASPSDEEINESFERIVHCGSFYAMKRVTKNYAIRDLKLTSIDADNRTVRLQWNSPFLSSDRNKPIMIKVFYTNSLHSRLSADIKENFDSDSNVAEFEIVQNEGNERYADSLYEVMPEEPFLPPYTSAMPYDYKTSNSLRDVTIRVLSPNPGYYLLVVKERSDEKESKPSNIVTVYLKSNVPIVNSSAYASEDSQLSDGPYREQLHHGALTWIHILVICIVSVLVLVIIILVIICFTIRRHRQARKNSRDDYKDQLNSASKAQAMLDAEKTDSKSYYLNQDSNSLMSHSIHDKGPMTLPRSNASNNTSCSSVSTVDNHSTYLTAATLDQGPSPTSSNGPKNGDALLKELNVATLLPNSWDAKELLDHWGRVQEAKQRQESPPVVCVPSHSPSSLPSYGSSSMENYHQSYLCQPAIVKQGGVAQHYSTPTTMAHHHHQAGNYIPSDMGHPEYGHQSNTPLYAPYSNASSIWQQQHLPHFESTPTGYVMPPPQLNYDDNGLPEYSVVRKIHPSISQV